MAEALCVCTLEGGLLEVTEMRDSISRSSIYSLSSQCCSRKHRKEHAEALDTDAIKKQSYLQTMTCTKAHSLVKNMTFISTQDTQRCLWNCTLYVFLHNTLDQWFSIHVLGTHCSAHFVFSLFNTPDSDHQLIKREIHVLNWVSDKRDIQNVQSSVSPGPGLKTTALDTI